jgi:hypothetical protein
VALVGVGVVLAAVDEDLRAEGALDVRLLRVRFGRLLGRRPVLQARILVDLESILRISFGRNFQTKPTLVIFKFVI